MGFPPEFHYMTEVLQQLLEGAENLYGALAKRYGDAAWVGFRLAEILSLPLTRKQYLLELEEPLTRLTQLDEVLRAMSEASMGE